MHSDESAALVWPYLQIQGVAVLSVHCSAGAVELRNEIGRVLRVDLPGTLIFDYPTISAMSAMLATKLAPKDTEAPAEALSRCMTCIISCAVRLSAAMHQGCHILYPEVVVDLCRPSLSVQLRGADSSAPAIMVQDTSSRLPCQRLPCMHLDAITCIPLDRWNMDAIPESNLGGR